VFGPPAALCGILTESQVNLWTLLVFPHLNKKTMYRAPLLALFALPLIFCAVGIYLYVSANQASNTNIAGPVKTDYVATFNSKLESGDPADNAAIELIKIFGPTAVPENLRRIYAEELGIDFDQLEDSDSLPFFKDSMPSADSELFASGLSKAKTQAWNKENAGQGLQTVAAWLRMNQSASDRAVAALDLPDFYLPMLKESPDQWLFEVPLPFSQKCIQLSLLLRVRALLAIGENRFADALRDLLAIRKLSRKITHLPLQWLLMENLVIEENAWAVEIELLNSENITSVQLLSYRDKLLGLERALTSAEKIDIGVRLLHRDFVTNLARKKQDDLHPRMEGEWQHYFGVFQKLGVDFDESSAEIDRYVDQIVTSSELATAQEQTQELDRLLPAIGTGHGFFKLMLANEKERGRILAQMVLNIFRPRLRIMLIQDKMVEARDAVMLLALEIRAAKLEGKSYPQDIYELRSQVDGSLLQSPLDGQVIQYGLIQDGFSLGFDRGRIASEVRLHFPLELQVGHRTGEQKTVLQSLDVLTWLRGSGH
jgi:hypothetical protein